MDGTDVREQGELNGETEQTQVDSDRTAGTDVEQELDGASLMEQFLSDPDHDYKTLKYGDVLESVVMHKDRDELLVDIGSKAEGIVPAKEYSSLTDEEKEALAVGDTILVFVVQPENQEGHPVVSIDRARQEKSWRHLQERHEANEVIEAEVTNYNKGGLLVNLDGVRGFVPASQVTEIRGGDESSKQADMARLIGTSLPLKVIEINRHRNRLILSERQAVQERRDAMKEQLIKELTEGEVRTGTVSSLCDFGAFVDIGGADGLVHLSELSWSRVRHPSEVLKINDEVQVYVLGINADEKKIALSIKRTQPEPWSRVATSYEVGQLVKGTVTQLANFGAFARIEDGIEGLIHVSELAEERIQHPKQVVEEGEELILRIIRIDPQRRRMGLSLRRALDTPDAELTGVFGEDILAERDNLSRTVRARLDAEGLTGQVAQPNQEQAPPESAEALQELDEETAQQASGEAQVAAFEERRRRAEESEQARQRRQEERRQRQTQSTSEFGDGDMSAMAMAFAQAGASDLDDLITQGGQPEAEADAPSDPDTGQSASAAADVAGEEAVAPDAPAESASEPTADDLPESVALGSDAQSLDTETTAQALAGDTPVGEEIGASETITDAGPQASKVIVDENAADSGGVVPKPDTEQTENQEPEEQE
jgi:small subunit ribosomal protein S1